MKSDLRDLTEGSLWQKIFVFSLPLMASNLLQVLFNMSDIAVVGRFAGPTALGAVGSTTILVTLFTGFLIGMGSGVNVLAARYYGARDMEDLDGLVHTGLLLCAAVGGIILLAGLVLARPILGLLGTKPDLIDGAALYLRIYFLGMPALAVYNYGNGVFSAVGDTRRPLQFLSVSGALNVALNLFFVIVCRMDVAGVAAASVLSQYVSSVLILRALARSRGLRADRIRLDRGKSRQLLAVGLPAGVQNGIFQLANLFVQAGVNTFDTTMVAGNSAAANADGLVYDVMAAFYTACGSFIGQNYGAGKKERILKSYRVSLAYSFGAGAVLGGALVLAGPQFLGLFTTDAGVAAAGMYRLTIMGFSYAVSAFMDCTIAASRGLGKSLVPTVVVVLGSCVFRVVWIYTVFAYFGTIRSLYLLYVFSWTITAVAEMAYFRYIYRRTVVGV